MTKRLASVLLLFAFLAPLATACSDDTCVCTLELRTIFLNVENPDGTPARGVEIEVTRVSDGRMIPPPPDPADDGNYPVLADDAVGLVEPGGTEIRVTGTRGERGFETVLLVGRDECGCHIEKISGPDRVMLSESS